MAADFQVLSLPDYGVLKQTIVQSPVINQIIPARIRSPGLKDVVYVGETFIELYSLRDDGKPIKIAAKSDFGASIRHANVLGIQPPFPLVQEPSEIVEDLKSLLPLQYLVLALDTGHVLFIYAEQQGSEVKFKTSSRKIDSKGLHPRTLGKALAVDPHSRCLAVTAYQDVFRIYALKDQATIHRELQDGHSLNPVIEEKTVIVNGLILHLEFLHPTSSADDHVIILVVIMDSRQKIRLLLYDWLTSKPIATATRYGSQGLRLPDEISLPLHIIPLLIDTAFLIVTEQFIYAARLADVQSGNAQFLVMRIPGTDTGKEKQSLVTAWARPLRTATHIRTMDDLYLALENGDIYFVEVDFEQKEFLQLINRAARLDCFIGPAFAALDYGLERNDLLIAGGEMSTGGVYLMKIGPSLPHAKSQESDEPIVEKSGGNWSPIFDFVLINSGTAGNTEDSLSRDRMYSCMGRGTDGAIGEIRYGIPGRKQCRAPFLPNTRQFWVLADHFVLCSLPDCSLLCFMNLVDDPEDCSEDTFLDMRHTTITAATFLSHVIQITSASIIVGTIEWDSTSKGADPSNESKCPRLIESPWYQKSYNSEEIISASVSGRYFVMVLKDGQNISLILSRIVVGDDERCNSVDQIGDRIILQDEPSCVNLSHVDDRVIAVVGTRAATIQVYLVDPHIGLLPSLETSLSDVYGDLPRSGPTSFRDCYICESVTFLCASSSFFLICGLRGGSLQTYKTSWVKGNLVLSTMEKLDLGSVPIQVVPGASRNTETMIFVQAGPEIYRLKLEDTGLSVIFQIIFEDVAAQPDILAGYRMNTETPSESVLMCVTNEEVFHATISHDPKVCVRRMNVPGTPRRAS